MSTGLAEVTARAYDLFEAGDLSAAQSLLGDALAAADTDPGNASSALAEAASLHSRVLVRLGEPHSARAWAAFAYEAESRLYGPSDERTIRAAATLAAVLHRTGNQADSAALYAVVIEGLTALEGPESPQVLAAHADLATVEYARGECDVARARLAEAWDMTREAYGDAHPAGIRMLARLGAMERDCGHFTEAHQHLAHARELTRAYLEPDDPLVAQIAALSRAPANPHHNCGGPALPTAPTDDEAYPGLQDVDGSPLDLPPAQGEAPPHRPQSPVPPDVAETWRPDETSARLPVHVPRQRRRRRGPAPLVTGALVAAVIGAVAVVVGLAAVDRGQDPEETAPPAASWPPPPATTAPQTSAPPASRPPASPTGPARARPGTPPSRVTLDDGGESITLRWAYPLGAQGKVRVSGAPKGQQQRPFEDLPAGSTTYVVHGLDQDSDFCFEIAVVYPGNNLGRAKPVCTTRTG
ncbi:tetratricopeptide repeat protein [Phytohabitans sp. ZYX-F-186]|uniref:Tetratricopeptide repeat protein n=1 Tax=Phytohabitans maris TaxID=3071409 RepID=A0ABU0ZG57_9ACTN|nr:tetratricopeptide repeat protein [Phytohabitans sp. ZYX-F-186]MDQ7906034.1 tetratricopeptide repeat protein [Phytohabitans sp. ZYX-F-186]